MARVTVEDCVQRVPNRFELVLLAAQRARNLSRGEELTVDRDSDKNPVVALREIAEETVPLAKLEQDLVKSLSRAPEPEPAPAPLPPASRPSTHGETENAPRAVAPATPPS